MSISATERLPVLTITPPTNTQILTTWLAWTGTDHAFVSYHPVGGAIVHPDYRNADADQPVGLAAVASDF